MANLYPCKQAIATWLTDTNTHFNETVTMVVAHEVKMCKFY